MCARCLRACAFMYVVVNEKSTTTCAWFNGQKILVPCAVGHRDAIQTVKFNRRFVVTGGLVCKLVLLVVVVLYEL